MFVCVGDCTYAVTWAKLSRRHRRLKTHNNRNNNNIISAAYERIPQACKKAEKKKTTKQGIRSSVRFTKRRSEALNANLCLCSVSPVAEKWWRSIETHTHPSGETAYSATNEHLRGGLIETYSYSKQETGSRPSYCVQCRVSCPLPTELGLTKP